MSEMVERAARAIAVQGGRDPDRQYAGAYEWQAYEGIARAVIEAMREPTEAMLKAAYALHADDTVWDKTTAPPRLVHKLGRAGPGEDFRAMIDAALKGKT